MSGERPPKIPLWDRLYLSAGVHIATFALICGALGVIYFFSHWCWFADAYAKDTRNTAKLSFKGYGIFLDQESQEYVFETNGHPLDLETLKAPYGLETYPSFQGSLNYKASIAEQLNLLVAQQKKRVEILLIPDLRDFSQVQHVHSTPIYQIVSF